MTQNAPRHLSVVEFYITNVCNLACDNCNRFNNYDFKGWQRWSDHAGEYAKWAQHLQFDKIAILGGEPLLNPTLLEWCRGIRQLWPQSAIQIVTNGYQLNRVPGLYEVLQDNEILLHVTLHNDQEEEFVYGQIHKFLQGAEIKSRDDNKGIVLFADHNRVGVWTKKEYKFVTSAIRQLSGGRLTLHDSDPHLAHKVCTFAQNKTYHFVGGKLHKCGPVALFGEFDRQHRLDISDSDRALLQSYLPFSADKFATHAEQIMEFLDQPLPQCKFCPESYQQQHIQAIPKGQRKTINIVNRS